MKFWPLSLQSALILATLTLFSEMWRGFLDAMLVLPNDFNQPWMMQLAALIFTALFAGWGWAIVVAWQGRRRALYVTFSINIIVLVIIPVSWLLFYCPAGCRVEAGIFNLANSLNLVLGLLTTFALLPHLGQQAWLPKEEPI